ncbi:hypothetical protein BH23ACT10_BH23ACT10_28230 [soil metagenome]
MLDRATPSAHRVLALLTLLMLLGACTDLPGAASDAAGDDADTPTESVTASEIASDGASEGASEAASEPAADATEVTVELDEWTVAPMPDTVPAGAVELTAVNVGQAPHEMVIVKAPASGELAVDEDGAVDEDALGADALIGEVEGLKSGEQGSLSVDLPAGDYVLLCNLVHVDGPITESHYKFGMADDFTVTEG